VRHVTPSRPVRPRAAPPHARATHAEVYLFARRPTPRVLLLRRASGEILPGVWQPVTGRIRRTESALEAAKREVREESGLKPTRWWKLESVVVTLDVASDELRVVPLFAAEVGGGAVVKLSREHDTSQFVTLAAAAKRVLWDTQRAGLRALAGQVLRGGALADALEIHDRIRPRAGGNRPARGARRRR
jgi:dATP pyrophosphohydrolase